MAGGALELLCVLHASSSQLVRRSARFEREVNGPYPVPTDFHDQRKRPETYRRFEVGGAWDGK
jgi:hypothetical protein